MSNKEMILVIEQMNRIDNGIAIRKGNDGFWYAAYVPVITPPQEVKWECYPNVIDAMRHKAD